MEHEQLWQLGVQSLTALEDERGILASAREEVYGCIFGRDSLITSLALLRAYERAPAETIGEVHIEYFLALVRKVLANLCDLQGTRVVIESGEEPGKCIHEFRPSGHERLTKSAQEPWYLYPDNIMRNYDTVDATPLMLLAFWEYYRVSGDERFITEYRSHIVAALRWVLDYGDTNGDGFVDYRFHPNRTYGGLRAQSWMDSTESLFFEESDEKPSYPIAPVEVQAYAYAALRAWSEYFARADQQFAAALAARAVGLKAQFAAAFVVRASRPEYTSLAFALDGSGRQLRSARSSMGHVLWATYRAPGEAADGILQGDLAHGVARRLLARDLFVPRAGVRTLSSRSRRYDPVSYHNGSIWPHDTAILAEGLEQEGFVVEAQEVRSALLAAYEHFKTPLELFGYSGGKYRVYHTSEGGTACQVQAWSAASLLSILTARAAAGIL